MIKRYLTVLDERFFYQRLNFLQLSDFVALEKQVTTLERTYSLSGNRIAYLAAASHFFVPITQSLAASGLAHKVAPGQKTWQRIVYEKPFGHDREIGT